MKLEVFSAERWMDEYDTGIRYNLNTTCPGALSVDGLLELCDVDKQDFASRLLGKTLGYGAVLGDPGLRNGLAGLYTGLSPDDIMTTHGATGANHLVLFALTGPGDRVISVKPTYQQLYSLPQCFGADVDILPLRREKGWLPDLEELAALARGGVKLICLNSPGNPTGALMDEGMLTRIADIAREAGAWVLCDEAYRGLQADGGLAPSIVDIYEKGISTSSMSKGFSMPGLRLGWIASRDKAALTACLEKRDYNTITCGILDEAVAALALEHREVIRARNNALLQRNLAILSQWADSRPDISWVRPRGGTTALLHYDFSMDSRDFCRALLADTGVYVIPGDCFEVPLSFRVGLGGDESELSAGLAVLGSYLDSHAKCVNEQTTQKQ